ncbi:CAP domain-containing protein [uncultured Demequina sp.]|uniref:CAP domain-containing protein n=1 Tax=uncultured Demequina sp. TaxID=693499 RepID=UPI0025EF0D19|nr:CAP domain-containing protein [uncultured Demequina sp.]
MTRPRRTFRTLVAAASALLTAAAVAGCSNAVDPVELPSTEQFEQELLDQINALRVTEGLAGLDASECMAQHARERATQLPGAVDVPRDELPADCGDFDYAGENVSRSDQSAAEVVDAWAAQETQRPNLVDPLFVEAGVGCVGVAAADTTRVAEEGEDVAGMACSVIFQGTAE